MHIKNQNANKQLLASRHNNPELCTCELDTLTHSPHAVLNTLRTIWSCSSSTMQCIPIAVLCKYKCKLCNHSSQNIISATVTLFCTTAGKFAFHNVILSAVHVHITQFVTSLQIPRENLTNTIMYLAGYFIPSLKARRLISEF